MEEETIEGRRCKEKLTFLTGNGQIKLFIMKITAAKKSIRRYWL